ncbi:hypothetical protein D917_10725 [Trichinella nativa]|uniref:Uncharacterized protein n=1 Tax=Trichinella nativa TaxID=6335 RepID=A0A1Y3E9S6_9BILA|nr:hypothetical protein D917_10725 [Trichinella nativa]
MRMSKPKKEEASGILEIAVQHFEIAAAVNCLSGAEKLKWLPLSLSQKVRSTFRQLPPPAWSVYRSCVTSFKETKFKEKKQRKIGSPEQRSRLSC